MRNARLFLQLVLILVLLLPSVSRATINCEDIPNFSGEQWAGAINDDGAVIILVFQDGSNQSLEYLYDASATTTTLLLTAESEVITDGHRVRVNAQGEWHEFIRVGDYEDLGIDDDARGMTYIPPQCDGTPVSDLGSFCILGSSCCFKCACVHYYLGIEWLNAICGGGGC